MTRTSNVGPEAVTSNAARPRACANEYPRSGPRTTSAVAHASASMAVSATTLTAMGGCSTGRAVVGSIMCE